MEVFESNTETHSLSNIITEFAMIFLKTVLVTWTYTWQSDFISSYKTELNWGSILDVGPLLSTKLQREVGGGKARLGLRLEALWTLTPEDTFLSFSFHPGMLFLTVS